MDATVDLGALRSLAVAETQGDRFACSEGHETLARLHVQQGAPEDALRHVTAALDIGVELDAPRLLWTALATASSLAQEQGAPEAAARWLAVSESLREALGEDLGPMAAASRNDRTVKLYGLFFPDVVAKTGNFAGAGRHSSWYVGSHTRPWMAKRPVT